MLPSGKWHASREFAVARRPASHPSPRRATVPAVEASELPGAGDDRLNPPVVTPEPAPADDRLVTIALVSAAVGLVLALLAARWVRRNLTITRRVG